MVLKHVQISHTKKSQFTNTATLRDSILAKIPESSNQEFYTEFSDPKIVAACVSIAGAKADEAKIVKYLKVQQSAKKQLVDNCVRKLGGGAAPAAGAPPGGAPSTGGAEQVPASPEAAADAAGASPAEGETPAPDA
jgi:hypothetical protein